MIQHLVIKQPPTVNSITNINRGNKQKAGRIKKQWTTAIAQAAKQQNLQPFAAEIWILIEFTYKSVLSDPDNLYGSLKPVFDGLVKAEIIKKDNVQIIKSPQLFSYKKGDERIVKIWMFDDKKEWFIFARELGLFD